MRKLAYLIPAVIAPIALLCIAREGLGVSPDSVSYLSQAQNLLAGQGLVMFDGQPTALWPPLFPLLIAFLQYLGLGAIAAATLINAVAWFTTTAVAGKWTLESTDSWRAALIVALFIGLSPTLYASSLYVWSEPLFCALALASLYLFDRHLRSGRWSSLLGAAVLCGLAFLQRYPGLAVLIVQVGLLVLFPASSLRRKFQAIALLLAVFALFAVPWLTRNYELTGTLFGPRYSGMYTAVEVIRLFLAEVGGWFVPGRVPGVIKVVLGLSAVLLATVRVLVDLGRMVFSGGKHVAASDRAVLGSFVGIYAAMMLWATHSTNTCCMDARYLSPLFAPLFIVFAIMGCAWIRALTSSDRWKHVRVLPFAAAGALALMLVLPVLRDWTLSREYLARGPGGYAARNWKVSSALARLTQLPAGAIVFSNHPEAVYLHTGRMSMQTPRKTPYFSRQASDTTANFLAELSPGKGPHLLVWFHANRSYLHDLSYLQRIARLTLIDAYADASVYSVDAD